MEELNFKKAEDFVKHVNKVRLDNKGKWWYVTAEVCGIKVSIKGYETWMQIYRVDGINCSNSLERSVANFKKDILKPIENTLSKRDSI